MRRGEAGLRDVHQRLKRLETQMQASRPSWSSDIEAARTRAAARARLKIGEALHVAWHPAVESARDLLIGDTPAQASADLEILQRWGRQYPAALYPADGTRARIMARMEEMAQRMQAQP
jgi:hypothetical protein